MLKKSVQNLVAEADAAVESIDPDEAVKLVGQADVQFVDVREPGEVSKSGLVTGAINVPRGLLEFQVDPNSPTHKPVLASAARLVLYCGSGARSALATKSLMEMGVTNIVHVPGGFAALKAAGAKIDPP